MLINFWQDSRQEEKSPPAEWELFPAGNLRHIWGRGVDTGVFSPRQRSIPWRLRLSEGCPEAPLLLYVGRLSHEKRLERLASILQALPDIRLAIIGEGPARKILEAYFSYTPTVFFDFMEQKELAAVYASADLFVLPSPCDTLENTVLEAMASGIPVVTVQGGGQIRHVQHGKTGLVVPENEKEFVAGIQQLIENPSLARQLGAVARQYAETQSWDSILERLFE